MGWALKQLHPLSTPNSKIKSLGFGGRQRLGSVFLLCPLLCGLGKLVNLSDAQLHPLHNGDYMNTHVGALKAAAPTTHSARPSGEPSPHTWLSFLRFWWAGGTGAAPGWQTEEGSYPRPSWSCSDQPPPGLTQDHAVETLARLPGGHQQGSSYFCKIEVPAVTARGGSWEPKDLPSAARGTITRYLSAIKS